MRVIRAIWNKAGHWLLLFLATDGIFLFTAWLLRPKMLKSIALFLILFTAIVISIGLAIDRKKQKKQIRAMQRFLEETNEENARRLASAMGISWQSIISGLYSRIEELMNTINEKQLNAENYRDYIEAWTHEIKTPLSLATLVMANHKEEMSPYVNSRMQYVLHLITEDVARILYYARLQADHVDYHFTRVRLEGLVLETADEFRTYAEEKGIELCLNIQPAQVVTDKKVLQFMLSQLVSNALKYADSEHGKVCISVETTTEQAIVSVWDNGSGALPEDVPFLFDKGFVGGHPDRQKATGMGLYLVRKFADAMGIDVRIDPLSTSGNGFFIKLIFQC